MPPGQVGKKPWPLWVDEEEAGAVCRLAMAGGGNIIDGTMAVHLSDWSRSTSGLVEGMEGAWLTAGIGLRMGTCGRGPFPSLGCFCQPQRYY